MKLTGRKFGYVKVSSQSQDHKCQVEELIEAGVVKELIFTDKASGKEVNRIEYQTLKSKLSEGDELYIHAVDRLGRSKEDTKKEFQELKDKGVVFRVLNLPTTLRQVPEENEFIFDIMNNLLLDVLTKMAEEERNNIKKRQRAGIDSMIIDEATGKRISTKTGKAMGRPARQFPKGWEDAYNNWKVGKVTATATMELLGIKRNTFYRLVKDYEGDNK